jgi:dTDP-glucose 4,6-dehydratase
MRVLVTGAAGFLGSHLVDRLLREGDELLGVDNLSTGDEENLAHLKSDPRFHFERRDICHPFDPGPVDYVFNFASPASPPEYLRLGIETLRVGSLGVENTLQIALRHHAGYLQASTSECYGDPLEHPQTESYWGNVNPVGPRSVYDESKRFAEAMVMAYQRTHGVNTHLVRIFNTYGPRLRPGDGRVISNFMMQALCGEPLTVYGDGSQTRSFCYVDDLIEGIVRLGAVTSICRLTSAIQRSTRSGSAPRLCSRPPARKASCASSICPRTIPPAASPTSPRRASCSAGRRASASKMGFSVRLNTSSAKPPSPSARPYRLMAFRQAFEQK